MSFQELYNDNLIDQEEEEEEDEQGFLDFHLGLSTETGNDINTTENAIDATNNQELVEAFVNNNNDNEQLVDGLTNERETKTGPEEVNKIAKTSLSRAAKEKKNCNKSLTQKEHLKKHSKIQNKSDNQAESNKSIAISPLRSYYQSTKSKLFSSRIMNNNRNEPILSLIPNSSAGLSKSGHSSLSFPQFPTCSPCEISLFREPSARGSSTSNPTPNPSPFNVEQLLSNCIFSEDGDVEAGL